MIGEVGFTKDNLIFFRMGDFYIECWKFQQLVEIKSVESWWEEGTVVLQTNYGAEAYWLHCFAEEQGMDVDFPALMNQVTGFVVTRDQIWTEGDCV